jgi:hypothetical protein
MGLMINDQYDRMIALLQTKKTKMEDVTIKNKNDVDFYFDDSSASGFDATKIITNGKVFKFTPWAYSQFCSRLKVPAGFLENNPAKIQKDVLTHWKNELSPKSGYLFRTFKPTEPGGAYTLRAALSGRYGVVDDLDLMELTSEVVNRFTDGTSIGKFRVSDMMSTTHVLSEKQINIGGDLWKVGVNISNSEVGYASIMVEVGLFRLICTNGLMVSKLFGNPIRRIHIGSVWSDIRETIKKYIGVINSDAIHAPIINTIRNAQGHKLTKEDIDRISELIGKETFNKALEDSREVIPTAFGIANSLSQLSHKYEAHVKYDMDSAAGKILELAA